MIVQLSGKLIEKQPDHAVIDVNGVGYHTFITLFTYSQLPEKGHPVTLITYTHVREDALSLFGFSNREERDFFLLLMGVTKVGAKMARNILSGIQPDELCYAVETESLPILKKIPGVGEKLAQQIILELKSKIKKLTISKTKSNLIQPTGKSDNTSSLLSDVYSALENLGYPPQQINKTLQEIKATRNLEQTSLENAIKIAFKAISE